MEADDTKFDRKQRFFRGDLIFFQSLYFAFAACLFWNSHGSGDKNSTMPKQAARANLFMTLLFILGLATSFILLGFGAGAISAFISQRIFTVVGGLMMILFGSIQLDLIQSNFRPQISPSLMNSDKPKNLRAYLLGVLLSLGWTPCIGTVFASVLVLAAQSGTALQGALFMAVYALGLAIPFLVIALFADTLLQKVKRLNRWTMLFKKIGGLFLIIIGILLMTNRLMF